jgi:nicotinamidase-related amidase
MNAGRWCSAWRGSCAWRALEIPSSPPPKTSSATVPGAGSASLLPPETTAFNKMIFGLMSQPDIRAAVDATGRDCFVLVGLETDVCIAHSALGLAAARHRAVVIDDACASPPPHHQHGLRRLRDAGIVVTSVKGIFYEWVRDLATNHQLKPQLNVALPEGLTL